MQIDATINWTCAVHTVPTQCKQNNLKKINQFRKKSEQQQPISMDANENLIHTMAIVVAIHIAIYNFNVDVDIYVRQSSAGQVAHSWW